MIKNRHHVVMINNYHIQYLAFQCLGCSRNLQNEQKINRKRIEIGLRITCGRIGRINGGNYDPRMSYVMFIRHLMKIRRVWAGLPNIMCRVYVTSYDNHTIWVRPPKCHIRLDPPSYDMINDYRIWSLNRPRSVLQSYGMINDYQLVV